MPTTAAISDYDSDYEEERGKPVPSWNHGMIQANLIAALARYRDRYAVVSELSLELGDLRVTPDICLYPEQPMDLTRDTLRVAEPPLLAVEITSPLQSTQELVDKIHAMLDAGVRSCWLVQPAMQTVTVYRPGAKPRTFSEGVVEEGTLEGVEVTVDDVFGDAG